MSEYRLTDTPTVVRTADNVFIPDDPNNRDRIEYDKWLADGGVPDPYVPPEPDPPAPPDLALWSDQYEAVVGASTGESVMGRVGWDNADPTQATTIFIAKLNNAGSDVTSMLSAVLQPGRALRFESRGDSTKFVSHGVVSATARTSDIAVTVTPRNNAGLPFAKAEALSTAVYIVDASTPARSFP
jgi:hypothetical protein